MFSIVNSELAGIKAQRTGRGVLRFRSNNLTSTSDPLLSMVIDESPELLSVGEFFRVLARMGQGSPLGSSSGLWYLGL